MLATVKKNSNITINLLTVAFVLSGILTVATAQAAERRGQAAHDDLVYFTFNLGTDWRWQSAESTQAKGYYYTRASKGETLRVRLINRKTSCVGNGLSCTGEFYTLTGSTGGVNATETISFPKVAAKFFGIRPYRLSANKLSAYSCATSKNGNKNCDTLVYFPDRRELVKITYTRPGRLINGLDFGALLSSMDVKTAQDDRNLPLGSSIELPQAGATPVGGN